MRTENLLWPFKAMPMEGADGRWQGERRTQNSQKVLLLASNQEESIGMGGACSRKREQGDAQNEGGMHEGPRGTLSRTISLRWPLKVPTIQKSESFAKHGSWSAPSLLELSVQALCQVIKFRYSELNRHQRDSQFLWKCGSWVAFWVCEKKTKFRWLNECKWAMIFWNHDPVAEHQNIPNFGGNTPWFDTADSEWACAAPAFNSVCSPCFSRLFLAGKLWALLCVLFYASKCSVVMW
jgi:hypothetical protein